MSSYQQEQIGALQMVMEHLQSLSEEDQRALADLIAEYLVFRKNVDEFLSAHLSDVCTLKCYKNCLSASEEEMRLLVRVLGETNRGFKCIYLGADGCRWHLKPIVCEMFICDDAQKHIFNSTPEVRQKWEEFKQLKKHFTWPDRPVLFDALEAIFIKAGYTSPLMYLHNSPGLLRVKQRANLKCTMKKGISIQ